MIAYLLAYILIFSVFSNAWSFVLLTVTSYFLAPNEEKPRVFVAFMLAFLIFLLFISPKIGNYQKGDYYKNTTEKFTFIQPVRDYMIEKEDSLNENAKVIYSSLIMGKLDYYSNIGSLVKAHGILHLFVVSGFHFSILFIFITFLLNNLLKVPYKITLIVVLVLASFYYMILGSGFGAMRAYLTIVLGGLAFYLGRSTDSENVLFTISVFWIILFPTSLYQLGFQLTFVATYLLILSSKIKYIKNVDSDILKNVILSLIVSFGVSAFLFFNGKSIALLSFLLIALSTPVIAFLMIVMFVFAILPSNGFLISQFLSNIINYIADIYYNFLASFANLSTLKYNFNINLAIVLQASILFLFFSRKLRSYTWTKNNIIILFFITILCFIL